MRVVDVQIDEVLQATTSLHGYWLINNIESIAPKLESSIISYGKTKTIERLKDIDSSLVHNLYNDIKLARETA